MESFEYNGIWWFPEFPDHRVSGTLRFDPQEGATLEAIGGDFTAPITKLFGIPKGVADTWTRIPTDNTVDLICGFTAKGDMVTLYKCYEGGQTWSRGYRGTTFAVSTVFIGCHFEHVEDVKFDSILVNYTYLNEWVGLTGFEGGGRKTKAGKLRYVRYKYTPRKKITTRIQTWDISFVFDIHVETDNFVDVHAKQITYIEIKPDQPAHYDTYNKEIIGYLQSFLSLGLGRAVFPEVSIGFNENCRIEATKGKTIPRPISLYRSEGQRPSHKEKLYPWDFLFQYGNLSDNFEFHLNNWFDKIELLRPVHDLYFGLLYIPAMYLHLEFLTLTQALETYHRRLHDENFMPQKDYEQVQRELIKAIPKEVSSNHRDSLKSRIKYGNEYPLHKRLTLILTDVLNIYHEEASTLIENPKTFARRVVDTRNYLTHYSEELEKSAVLDSEELNRLVQQLKLLLQLCFLAEIGLPEAKVKIIFANNHVFRNWSDVLD